MLIEKLILAAVLGSLVLAWLLLDKATTPKEPERKRTTLQGFINSKVNNRVK